MGFLTGLVTLPLAPVRGVIWIAERIEEQASRELSDQGQIIRQLEELEDARDAGEISAEEADRAEAALLGRLTAARRAASAGGEPPS